MIPGMGGQGLGGGQGMGGQGMGGMGPLGGAGAQYATPWSYLAGLGGGGSR